MRLKPILIALMLFSPVVRAGLEGGVIVGGQGTIVNNHLVIQDSARLAINAAGFGVRLGETFNLRQNLASDIALIRVLGQDPSNIFGMINAKGQLFISNPNGVLFGHGAQVNVGALVATTLGLSVPDFMNGKFTFSNDGKAGSVINQGFLTAAQGGYVALLAPDVRNEGVISATMGTALLAAGDKVTLNLNNGELLGYTIDKGAVNALAVNKQLIQADGGQVFMGAKAADAVAMAAVNNSGVIRARSIQQHNGGIRLSGDAAITNTGTLDASAANTETTQVGSGGDITIGGRFVALGGTVTANSQVRGGQISVAATGDISLAGQATATGKTGKGGTVNYRAGGEMIASSTSVTEVSGASGGSIRMHAGQGVISSGTYRALGSAGKGGRVDISGRSVRLLSAKVDASGATQGGLVRIGGAFQGGRQQPDSQTANSAGYDQFVTRWQETADIANAQRVFVNDSTQVNVSSKQGAGGTAVIWSDKETTQLGQVNASGATRGGAVEISSADTLRRVELTGVTGADKLLLDPKNIIIGDSTNLASWTYGALLGSGYTGGNSVDVAGLAAHDYLGTSVAMNAAGDLMAVGAYGDDGASNMYASSGAVRLYSFTDGNFNGAALQGTLGKGYVGGKNIDVANLEANDNFGASVSLNGIGNGLAVGAIGDDGAGNLTTDSGAGYFFSFSGSNFDGGSLQGIMGKGYSGGKHIDVASLEAFDGFGSAVALNAVGNRLAMGAYGDDGAGNVALDSGAMYMYGFAGADFSGGSLLATIGKSYIGGNAIDVSQLESQDRFGIAAAFSAAGDRLAVGAFGDDGADNAATNSGAVYLYSFADNNVSGGNLRAIVGKGYSGGNNIHVSNLENSDGFGRALALSAAGNRLAVGAFNDGGFANVAPGSGAVYQLDFADGSFNAGNLHSIIGKGYVGARDVNLSQLDAGDYFGTSVAMNGSGDRLAVGAILDDGSGNAALNHGAVHLLTLVADALPSAIDMSDYPGQTVTILNTQLASLLSTGTNVVLQASNDITVEKAVTVNNSAGNGGDMTLQAGRNVNINAVITTDNGNLTAVAGDPAGIPSEREGGTAAVTLGNTAAIDAGTGEVTLAAVSGNFINQSGSSAPINASRWFIYSTDPSRNTLNGLLPDAVHYNQPYLAGAVPGYATSGNWMFYSAALGIPFPKFPADVIVNAQTPPPDRASQKPLSQAGCGDSLLVVSTASAIFERFNNAEEDTCELDFIDEEPPEESGMNKKRKCKPNTAQPPANADKQKL